MCRWHLIEHSGTHIDAPLHFANGGLAVDQIPLEQLMVPGWPTWTACGR